MKIRITILAACASTLVLMTTFAYAGEPIAGVDVKLGKNYGSGLVVKGNTTSPAGTKFREPDARLPEQKTNPGTARGSISDQGAASNLSSY